MATQYREPLAMRTACNRDCPDACEIIAELQDGRITRLRGATNHPVTQGFLCHRTSRFLERQYAADRLTQPLWRRNGKLQPIAWNEALDRIAQSMRSFRAESGPASLMHYRCGGSMGMMKHVTDWFFQRFGPVTTKSGDICSGAGEAAQTSDFGLCDSHDLFDLEQSRTIVLWGKNVFVSSVHLLPILRRAKQAGCRLILIDPVHHQTAQICDQFVQPKPGTDALLACGLARWLFDHGRHDPTASGYCDHYAAYQSLVHSRTIDEWAAAADVTTDELTRLAASYAEGPAAILVGWGMQRRRFGANTVRAIDALAAIAGNIGVPGGGVSFYFGRRTAFDFSSMQGEPSRTIPEPLLGPGILAASDPPIRMVWVTAANPVAMLPESATVAEALRTRELTVVVDAFLTDTAKCADVVLPTTTFLEEDDLLGAYGHHWLSEMRAVVAPPPAVLTDYQIVQQLAKRLDVGQEFSATVLAWKQRLLTKLNRHGVTLEDFRDGPVRNPMATKVLFADRTFPTASGNVNLWHDLPAELWEHATAPRDPASGNRELRLVALATAKAQSSQWQPAQQVGAATATVHPNAMPGARNGDRAKLSSDIGAIEVILQLDVHQRPDTVVMEKGGWFEAGRCANALVKAELTDDGQCAVYHDTVVELTEL